MPLFATGLTAGPVRVNFFPAPHPQKDLELLGDYLTGKAPATLVKRANSLIFMQNMLNQLGLFLANV